MITHRSSGAARHIGEARHDRGRVAVDRDHTGPLFAQGAHGLRAAVIELGRLVDDNGPGAQDHDALQLGGRGHLSLRFCVRERRSVRWSTRKAGAGCRSACRSGREKTPACPSDLKLWVETAGVP